MVDLAGQVAVVTGGTRGIGVEIAARLARAGARVSVWSRRPPAGTAHHAVACDVTDPAAVAAATARVEQELGPIDLLVNNAGLAGAWGRFEEVPPATWWRDFEVNLRGAALPTRTVLPGMIARRRGRVASMSSGMANVPNRYCAAYASSKCALVVLMERVAAEVAPYGVRTFSMAPGLVPTEMAGSDGFRRYSGFEDLPADEWQTAGDSAELVLRIAAGHADPLSGRFLHVKDDLDELLAEAAAGMSERRLRMRRPA
ncbi:MAG: meso-butanediol dehydrogenase / (S,S)-butanediol dehydrogenase / diacetyl reductase [Gaiellaceae bacterium]|nr:meso-butanediol dehydrogenase / (S,S)-butanediol dehydrogenase / diacetyl reductase [Gaiellaceae bacterium]